MIEFFIPPFVGALIGYITNDIAIRMLFRPHTAKYLFSIHIPFTPGIIPKEKGRIADAIGEVISVNLMNKEVLQRYLLSDEMVGKVRSTAESFFEKQKSNDETLKMFLGHILSDDEIRNVSSSVNGYLTDQISTKLTDSAIGVQVAHMAMDYVSDRLSGGGTDELLASVSGALRAAASLVITPLLAMLREPAENLLAKTINGMLSTNGSEIISGMVDGEIDSFLGKKVSTLLKEHDDQLAKAVNTIESIYRTVIEEHLPKILESIDIRKIVRDRINEMDVNEAEKLILKVMKKELNAIVWFGALLGFLMGFINIFLN